MPMNRLPDPEPDFNSDEWHEDEFGSSLQPYPDDAAIQGAPDAAMAPCEWFAYCTNDATTTQAHPVLGDVPICARCLNIFKQLGG